MSTEQVADIVTSGQKLGEALIGGALLLLTGFFVLHQTRQTGFFNQNFGTLEAILLYGPLLLAILDCAAQVIGGRHNPARPFEAASGLLLGVAAVWFLIHFPFEFSHLGDVLPEALRPLLGWVTNDLGRIPLVIQVIAGPVGAIQAIRAFLAGGG